MDELVEENRIALAQLSSCVEALSPEDFQRVFGDRGRHTIGKHVRHIIDHYDALQVGLEAGDVIDYEQRRRDPSLEDWPQLACRRLEAIQASLVSIRDDALSDLQLAYAAGDDGLYLQTSLGRELAFLTSHTIHHMAIIGLLAEQLGLQLPESFGVHPSTLRHWQRVPAEQAPLSRRSA